MFGFKKQKHPDVSAALRAQALDMAIRAAGTGAPISRIAEAAEAFYRFLTAKS